MIRHALAALLALLVFVPSATVAVKFLGGPLAGVYAAGLLALFSAILAIEGHQRAALAVRRHERALAAAWGLAMLGALALLLPVALSHVYGPGSDRMDALHVGVRALLDGRYPYHERTYLGLPLSPMPGALALAAPFELLGFGLLGLPGGVALQNLAYGIPCVLLAVAGLRRWRTRWLLVPALTLGNIAFLHDHVTGGDYVLNGLYVGVLFQLCAMAWDRDRIGAGAVAVAVVFGLALSSRTVFALAGLMLAAHLLRRRGWRRAGLLCLISAGTAAAATLPFLFHDPEVFLRIQLFRHLDRGPAWLAAAPAVAVLLALLPAVRDVRTDGLFLPLGASLLAGMLPEVIARMGPHREALYYLVPPALYLAYGLLVRCRAAGAETPADRHPSRAPGAAVRLQPASPFSSIDDSRRAKAAGSGSGSPSTMRA